MLCLDLEFLWKAGLAKDKDGFNKNMTTRFSWEDFLVRRKQETIEFVEGGILGNW